MIHCLASRPHYRRHCAPILDALGDSLGVRATRPNEIPPGVEPVIVAGAVDMQAVGATHPIIYLEHGSAQGYQGLQHVSWPGGVGRERIGLYLAPRQSVLDLHAVRNPHASGEVVGCAALDHHVATGPKETEVPVVAISAHWEAPASKEIPELRSAFSHYRDAMPTIVAGLREAGCDVIGHHHPRWKAMARYWQSLGVRVVSEWDDLLPFVDVLMVDNSSVGWEALALGRGVVWMNAPFYRRGIEHGLRFWREADRFGTQVDHPGVVVAAVLHEIEASHDGPAAMAEVYTYTDGRCAERAASAIREWASEYASG